MPEQIVDRCPRRLRRQAAKALQQKLDRLHDASIFAKSIDQPTYERQRDKVREELTLTQMNHHAEQLEEFDVEGLLAFAARILPKAADMWVQASLLQAGVRQARTPKRTMEVREICNEQLTILNIAPRYGSA